MANDHQQPVSLGEPDGRRDTGNTQVSSPVFGASAPEKNQRATSQAGALVVDARIAPASVQTIKVEPEEGGRAAAPVLPVVDVILPFDLDQLDPAKNGVLGLLRSIDRNTSYARVKGEPVDRHAYDRRPEKESYRSETGRTSDVFERTKERIQSSNNNSESHAEAQRVSEKSSAGGQARREGAVASQNVTAQTSNTNEKREKQQESTQSSRISLNESEQAESRIVSSEKTAAQEIRSSTVTGNTEKASTSEKASTREKVVEKPGVSEKTNKRTEASDKQSEPLTKAQLERLALRNESGQFISKEEKQAMSAGELQQARMRQERKEKESQDRQESIVSRLVKSTESVVMEGGDAVDAAGLAAGGAYYGAAKELVTAYEQVAGEDSKVRQSFSWVKEKLSGDSSKDSKEDAALSSNSNSSADYADRIREKALAEKALESASKAFSVVTENLQKKTSDSLSTNAAEASAAEVKESSSEIRAAEASAAEVRESSSLASKKIASRSIYASLHESESQSSSRHGDDSGNPASEQEEPQKTAVTPASQDTGKQESILSDASAYSESVGSVQDAASFAAIDSTHDSTTSTQADTGTAAASIAVEEVDRALLEIKAEKQLDEVGSEQKSTLQRVSSSLSELVGRISGYFSVRKDRGAGKQANTDHLSEELRETTVRESEIRTSEARQNTSSQIKAASENHSESQERLSEVIDTLEDGFESVSSSVTSASGGRGGGLLDLLGGGDGSAKGGSGRAGRLGRAARGVGGRMAGAAKGFGAKALGPLAALAAGGMAWNSTRNELAEREDLDESQKSTIATSTGIGAGGGALGGALAGGAAGAAIGSAVPVVGTAIGGILGSIVGGIAGAWGGEKVGRSVGEKLAGESEATLEQAITEKTASAQQEVASAISETRSESLTDQTEGGERTEGSEIKSGSIKPGSVSAEQSASTTAEVLERRIDSTGESGGSLTSVQRETLVETPKIEQQQVSAIDPREAIKALQSVVVQQLSPSKPERTKSSAVDADKARMLNKDSSSGTAFSRGSGSGQGLRDISVDFSDSILTLMAMDRI